MYSWYYIIIVWKTHFENNYIEKKNIIYIYTKYTEYPNKALFDLKRLGFIFFPHASHHMTNKNPWTNDVIELVLGFGKIDSIQQKQYKMEFLTLKTECKRSLVVFRNCHAQIQYITPTKHCSRNRSKTSQ